ncbi:MAG: hypothetical protein ACRDHZ_19420 [Ktedonobacteraceae bacterium]
MSDKKINVWRILLQDGEVIRFLVSRGGSNLDGWIFRLHRHGEIMHILYVLAFSRRSLIESAA